MRLSCDSVFSGSVPILLFWDVIVSVLLKFKRNLLSLSQLLIALLAFSCFFWTFLISFWWLEILSSTETSRFSRLAKFSSFINLIYEVVSTDWKNDNAYLEFCWTFPADAGTTWLLLLFYFCITLNFKMIIEFFTFSLWSYNRFWQVLFCFCLPAFRSLLVRYLEIIEKRSI